MSKKEEQNRLTEKNLENFLKMMERLRCLGWKGGNLRQKGGNLGWKGGNLEQKGCNLRQKGCNLEKEVFQGRIEKNDIGCLQGLANHRRDFLHHRKRSCLFTK